MRYILILLFLVGCGGSESEDVVIEQPTFEEQLEQQITKLEYKDNKLVAE